MNEYFIHYSFYDVLLLKEINTKGIFIANNALEAFNELFNKLNNYCIFSKHNIEECKLKLINIKRI